MKQQQEYTDKMKQHLQEMLEGGVGMPESIDNEMLKDALEGLENAAVHPSQLNNVQSELQQKLKAQISQKQRQRRGHDRKAKVGSFIYVLTFFILLIIIMAFVYFLYV